MSDPKFQVTLVNDNNLLPTANISLQFLIELVMVTEDWTMYVPIVGGQERITGAKEGIRRVVEIKDDKLERPEKLERLDSLLEKELGPLLSSAAVVQAICSCNRIGSVWIVQ